MNHMRKWNCVVVGMEMEVCHIGCFHSRVELVIEEEHLRPFWESSAAKEIGIGLAVCGAAASLAGPVGCYYPIEEFGRVAWAPYGPF